MKKLIYTWSCGWEYLLYDDLFSYYAFFTAILAEIAFLWAFLPNIAFPFTIFLTICILNVCFCACIASHVPRASCIIYSGTFLAVLIIGCFINVLASILLVILPFIFTIIGNFLKMLQISIPIGFPDESLEVKVFNLFEKKHWVYLLSQIFVTFGPFIIFTIFLALSPISILLKVIIPLIYLLIMPLIAYMEDSLATLSIFELFLPSC